MLTSYEQLFCQVRRCIAYGLHKAVKTHHASVPDKLFTLNKNERSISHNGIFIKLSHKDNDILLFNHLQSLTAHLRHE